ncbi:MAG: response regulator [Helicobacteraceae bacterium]|nr:response regulator [Helicobacteraceae bacterium]
MKPLNKIKILLIAIFSLVYALVYFATTHNKEKQISNIFANSISTLENNYKVSNNNYRKLANNIDNILIQTPQVLKLFYQAKHAKDENERSVYRDKIYNLLKPNYEHLRSLGLNIILFSFENNKVFLRVHKPNKFGDDISNVRYGVTYVNYDKKPIYGLEGGKVSHAFRNIFPLYYNNEYLGCIDISFSSEYMQENMRSLNGINTHFIINKNIFKHNIWESQNKIKYVPSIEHNDFLLAITDPEFHSVFTPKTHELTKNLKEDINKHIKNDSKFALYNHYKDHAYVIAFVPIKSIGANKSIAYIISYTQSLYLEEIINRHLIVNIIAIIVLLLLGIPVYYNIKQHMFLKVEVDRKTKDLKIQKERAEESGRLKEEFLANMSHEIRTPMNAVLGFTDILYEQIKEPKHLEYLKSIRSSGRQLLQIINDILEISKVQAGKMSINLNPVNPYSLLKDLHSIFKVKINDKNVDFIFDIDNKLPESLLLDEVRIRQVLFNVIGNAVKFTEKGFVKVTATKVYRDEDKSILDFIIKVQDTGIGINEKDQNNIFEPFIQQKGQSTNKFGGTGLGLSISKKLSKLMGGDITLQSTANEGSTFTIQIDNVSVSSTIADDTNSFEYERLKSYKFEYAKILLVDDIETNRTLIKNYFVNYNFDITEAENGADAVRLSTKGFDLILMDIKMPIMDEYEATDKIKSAVETAHIPIFALTASVLHNSAMKEKHKIFDSFLHKPIDKKSLVEEIATILPFTIESIDDVATLEEVPKTNSEVVNAELNDEAIAFINNQLIPLLNSSKDSGDIDKINDFMTTLQEFTQQYSITTLNDSIKKLQNCIEMFDIENIFLVLEDISIELGRIQ